MKKLLLGCTALIPLPAAAQQVPAPQATAALVCAYNSSLPTIAPGNFGYVQCDNQGRVVLNGILSGNVVIAGATSQTTSKLFWTGTMSGNCTSVAGCFANSLIISDDSLTSTSLNGSGNFQVQTTIANAVNTGGVVNFQSLLNITGLTGNAANQFFVSANLWGQVSGNMGGTGTGANARGSVTAINPQQLCIGTATFLTECSVDEHDLVVGAGASANLVYGVKVIMGALNRTAATTDSGGFVVAAQSGATNTLAGGYIAGQNGSDHGIASTGFLLGNITGGLSTINTGVQLANFAFSSSSIQGPNSQAFIIQTGSNRAFTVNDGGNGTVFNVVGVNAAVTASLNVTPGTAVGGTVTLSQQGAGTGGITINSAVGPLNLQGNGTTGIQIDTSGNTFLVTAASDSGATDATVCRRTSNGQLLAGSGVAGICLGTSSARFKHGVSDLDVDLANIMKLRPRQFYLNAEHGNPNKLLYGFIAEEAALALPKLVGYDDTGQINTFDYLGVVPVLVAAMQKMEKRLEKVEARTTR